MFNFLNTNASEVIEKRDTVLASFAEAEAFQAQAVLERFQNEQEIDETRAGLLWRELLRYLTMVDHFPDRKYGMYGPVDGLWHDFVIHTELYQDFCDRFAGRFLHHHPCTTEKGAGWRSRYLQFLIDYRLIFGEVPPEDIWSVPEIPFARLPESAGEIEQKHVESLARMDGDQRGVVTSLLGLVGIEVSLNHLSANGWEGSWGDDGDGGGGGGCGGCGG